MNNIREFNQAFDFFTKLILSNQNFAYARYADGEVALMKGRSVGLGSQAFHVDKWSSPNKLTKVGSELLETLNHSESNYYYAISSNTDWPDDFDFLTKRIIIKENITFANLWINANYQKMKKFYFDLNKSAYLICNHIAKKENFPFIVSEIFPFPDDCVGYWEHFGEDYISQLIEYISQLTNQTFFISCGPISEIIIHKLYTANPNNQYIDVGSSIDEFVHGTPTRPYMDLNSQFSKEISYFNN